jgi:hypothetical protein
MHTSPTDPRKHLVLEHHHDLAAGADQVFPLLCPVREYQWIHDWRCELVHTASGVVEKGCIFVTESPPEGRTTWVTSAHDPAARTVEFVRVAGQRLVTLMSLRVEPAGAGCRLHVGWALTALDPEGQALVDRARETGLPHAEVARSIALRLDHFLATGRMLTGHAPVR